MASFLQLFTLPLFQHEQMNSRLVNVRFELDSWKDSSGVKIAVQR